MGFDVGALGGNAVSQLGILQQMYAARDASLSSIGSGTQGLTLFGGPDQLLGPQGSAQLDSMLGDRGLGGATPSGFSGFSGLSGLSDLFGGGRGSPLGNTMGQLNILQDMFAARDAALARVDAIYHPDRAAAGGGSETQGLSGLFRQLGDMFKRVAELLDLAGSVRLPFSGA